MKAWALQVDSRAGRPVGPRGSAGTDERSDAARTRRICARLFPKKEVIPCLVRVFCATWHGQAVAASASESNEPIVICSPSW